MQSLSESGEWAPSDEFEARNGESDFQVPSASLGGATGCCWLFWPRMMVGKHGFMEVRRG